MSTHKKRRTKIYLQRDSLSMAPWENQTQQTKLGKPKKNGDSCLNFLHSSIPKTSGFIVCLVLRFQGVFWCVLFSPWSHPQRVSNCYFWFFQGLFLFSCCPRWWGEAEQEVFSGQRKVLKHRAETCPPWAHLLQAIAFPFLLDMQKLQKPWSC